MKKPHIGQNIQKVRVYLGVKQDTLAKELGITQQEVSKIEKQEFIEESILLNIADVLSISPEVIRNFDLEKAIKNIYNSEYESTVLGRKTDSVDELEFKLLEKIFELYERLLMSEREKIELLKLHNNN